MPTIIYTHCASCFGKKTANTDQLCDTCKQHEQKAIDAEKTAKGGRLERHYTLTIKGYRAVAE